MQALKIHGLERRRHANAWQASNVMCQFAIISSTEAEFLTSDNLLPAVGWVGVIVGCQYQYFNTHRDPCRSW